MSKQVRLNLVELSPPISTVTDSDPCLGIRGSMRSVGQHRVLRIDLTSTWWSTRLYLTAFLAERLTDVRRLVIVKGAEFVGLLSTSAILATLPGTHESLRKVHDQLVARPAPKADNESEMNAVFSVWTAAFEGREGSAKIDVSEDLLRRWFGDALLQQPVRIADLAQASVVDLLRMLDYPSDFVPVVSTRPLPAGAEPLPAGADPVNVDPIKVVDKTALNAQLAHSYVLELMDRARIS